MCFNDDDDDKDYEGSRHGPSRAVSLLTFMMRILAAISTLASAIAMRTTSAYHPSFTQFIPLKNAAYDSHLPAIMFFVVANGITSGYLVLSLVLSVWHIMKRHARRTRATLIILDTIILVLLTSGASAAAAIVYLSQNGNARANWAAICQQHNSFCQRASGSLVGSFIGVFMLMLLIFCSTIALSQC